MIHKIKIDGKDVSIRPQELKCLKILSSFPDMVADIYAFKHGPDQFYMPTFKVRLETLGLRTHQRTGVTHKSPKVVKEFYKKNPNVFLCVQGNQTKIKAILAKTNKA